LRDFYSTLQARLLPTNVSLRRVRATTVTVEYQQLLHIECVFVALVIQHAKRTPLL